MDNVSTNGTAGTPRITGAESSVQTTQGISGRRTGKRPQPIPTPVLALQAYHPRATVTVQAESGAGAPRIYADATITWADDSQPAVEVYATTPMAAHVIAGEVGGECTMHLSMSADALPVVIACLTEALARAQRLGLHDTARAEAWTTATTPSALPS